MLGSKQYYGLIAGLRTVSLDGEGDRGGFDARAIRDEITEELSRQDRRTVELFYGFTDITNILRARSDFPAEAISGSRRAIFTPVEGGIGVPTASERGAKIADGGAERARAGKSEQDLTLRAARTAFDAMGNYSRAELEEALAIGAAGSEAREKLPRWMADILGVWLDPENPEYEDIERGAKFERALFEAYYKQCAASPCRFLREWSRFDRGLRNVVAAHIARDKQMPTSDSLVGGGDIVLSLTRSQAADWGLKGELDYIDTLLAAMNESDALGKERAIDLIRWDKASELAEMDSFGMPTILAYLVDVGIVGRWMALDPATGRAMYERLVAGMSMENIKVQDK